MSRRIAVLGTGAIGGMLGGHLAHSGVDVTMISAYRRETAQTLDREGIYINGARGSFHTPIKAVFLDDIPAEVKFDYIFLGLKANNFVDSVSRVAPHLAEDGCIISLQNGINEELLVPIVGEKRVVAGISFAGGQQKDSNHYEDHDGHFVVGEMDGSMTPRLEEIVEILSHARPSASSDHVRVQQWEKLGTVALHVPCCTITGSYMQEGFDNPYVQRFFPLLAKEVFAVAEADGCTGFTIQGHTREEYEQGSTSVPTGQSSEGKGKIPEKVVDAYTRDIQRGAELEIDFTNGAIVRLGKRYGVPTPANEALISAIRDIEAGKAVAGNDLASRLLEELGG